MKMQKRETQRKMKKRRGAENGSDTVMLIFTPFKIWDTLKQFHPHKKEILNVVRILSSLGVNRNIIAATLGLKRWKTFYGNRQWTEGEVKVLLEGYEHKEKYYYQF